MTSGMPLVNSRTLFLTQLAALPLGGKCLIRAVKYADGDQHIRAAVKQIIAPESRICRIMGTKPSRTRLASCSAEPRLTLDFLMLANMILSSRSASQELLYLRGPSDAA